MSVTTIKIGQFKVTGEYTPAKENFGHRELADTPPEPAYFDVVSVENERGEDVTDELDTETVAEIEREAARLMKRAD